MNYYVYVFLDPDKPGKYEYLDFKFNFEPFYVGKGKGLRMTRHLNLSQLNAGNNTIKEGKLKRIMEKGFNPLDFVVMVRTKLEEKEAHDLEALLITTIGRLNLKTGVLANLTSGGEGMTGWVSSAKGKTYEERYGVVKAAEMKEVRRKKMLGSGNHMFGKQANNLGKSMSSSQKIKLSEAKKVKVVQQTLKGEPIKTWSSITEAANYYKVARSSIGNCLSGRSKTGIGYKWTYE
jgi:hypothetical protein